MSDKTMDLGGDSKSFAFDVVGDSVTGRIVDFEEMAQTDMQSGKPAVWDDGRAKMMLRIDLATSLLADAQDDGVRSVFIRGSKRADSGSSLAAVAKAIKDATGGTAIQVGATLTLTYTGEKAASQRGFNPAKMYSAAYAPKQASVEAAPAAAPVAPVASGPAALTPEQMAALIAKSQPAAAVDVIAAHPQGAALRAAGVPDDVIKASLGL